MKSANFTLPILALFLISTFSCEKAKIKRKGVDPVFQLDSALANDEIFTTLASSKVKIPLYMDSIVPVSNVLYYTSSGDSLYLSMGTAKLQNDSLKIYLSYGTGYVGYSLDITYANRAFYAVPKYSTDVLNVQTTESKKIFTKNLIKLDRENYTSGDTVYGYADVAVKTLETGRIVGTKGYFQLKVE